MDALVRILCFVGIGLLLWRFSEGHIAEGLWTSCKTPICGQSTLTIQCETNSVVFISDATSGAGSAIDRLGFLNLRRICMGFRTCNPSDFCRLFNNRPFNVSYICVAAHDVENDCQDVGKYLQRTSGFITSPNYPSETEYSACRWRIRVPEGQFLHIVLHEVLLFHDDRTSGSCVGGLIFKAKKVCPRKVVPTDTVCDEAEGNTTISTCGDTDIVMTVPGDNSMRFWLSYYVVPTSELRYVSLYDVGITCVVRALPEVIIDPSYYHRDNGTDSITTDPSNASSTTETIGTNVQYDTDEEDDYVLYAAIIPVVVLVVVGLILVFLYLRYRSKTKTAVIRHSSSSQISDIQKRPLPARIDTSDTDTDDNPVLQDSYCRVADEIPLEKEADYVYSPTYAEIEEFSDLDIGVKGKPASKSAPSKANAKRDLPAKPKERLNNSIYYEIDDSRPSEDTSLKKPVKGKAISERLSKYQSLCEKSNASETNLRKPNEKKTSKVGSVYSEAGDERKKDPEKPYKDMSGKPYRDSGYVTHAKSKKDMANLNRRHVKGANDQDSPYEDISRPEVGVKKESLTSDSDSDDIMVENELYEPYESAKV